jgi:ATP-dependent helicase HrpB
LPIDDYLGAIRAGLAEHSCLVLVAEPGAGKTSRVPPSLVADPALLKPGQHAVMLQPRRTAARSAAEWIAREQGWQVGEEVGYQVRFESRISLRSRLHVVTEGILTRRLLADAALEDCGLVILDEFHERSLDADLALLLLGESRDALRPDLKILVMSATIDAEKIAEHLGGCPIINVPGRNYPVEIEHDLSAAHLPIAGRMARAIENEARRANSGDILVFLPGQREIREVDAQLRPLVDSNVIQNTEIRSLHGSMPLGDQIATLKPGPRRRIILSTNIAETSLTIEGVTVVVDSGLARQAGFDDANGLDTLRTQRISAASARQRAGRAGRTGPGRAVRVWSAQEVLDPFDLPEIQRVDLAGFLLSCLSWGWVDLEKINWLTPPPDDRLKSALALLKSLGAVAKEGHTLTPAGRALADLPVHPRLGRILVEGRRLGCVDEAALLAAMIPERDFLDDSAARQMANRFGQRSDLMLRLDILRKNESVAGSGIDRDAVARVRQVARQLESIASRIKLPPADQPTTINDDDDEARLAQLLLAGFSDRVCRRSQRGATTAYMARGLGIRLAPASRERDTEFFLAIDPRREDGSHRGSEPIVRIAARLEKEWLEEWLADRIQTIKRLEFDESSGRARWQVEKKLHELVMGRHESPASPDELRQAFAVWAADHAQELLAEVPEVARWLGKYDTLRRLMPEKNWPEPVWAEAAAGWSDGCRSRADLLRRPALSWLQATLPPDAVRSVEQELPDSLTLPNGRSARIDYETGQEHPMIQARVQDFFGWRESPRLVQGRLPILLEILAPNQRPVQRTLDLKSFWANTYPQVRKDLRGRYPKHHWPEDPWTAEAGPSIRRPREN